MLQQPFHPAPSHYVCRKLLGGCHLQGINHTHDLRPVMHRGGGGRVSDLQLERLITLVPITTLNHNMQATNSPNNESSCSQCNFAVVAFCCGERASLPAINNSSFTNFVAKREECIA